MHQEIILYSQYAASGPHLSQWRFWRYCQQPRTQHNATNHQPANSQPKYHPTSQQHRIIRGPLRQRTTSSTSGTEDVLMSARQSASFRRRFVRPQTTDRRRQEVCI